MKFTVDKNLIKSGLFHPQKVSQQSGNLNPILTNIRIKAEKNNQIKIQATDTSTSVLAIIEGEVEEPASIIVSGKMLYQLISSFSSQQIEFELKDSQLVLTSGKSIFKINTMNDEDFPEIFIPEDDLFTDFEPAIFSKGVERTVFSVSKDDCKVHLTGIYFLCEKNLMTTVSTDGHRLSFSELPYEGDFELKKGIIIPDTGAQEIKRLADDAVGEFKIAYIADDKLFAVKSGNTTLTIKIIDSKYPPYEQVIPHYEDNKMVVEKSKLKTALKRMAVLATSKEAGVIFDFKDDYLSLKGTDTLKGTSNETMEVSYTGDSMEIAFNIYYLQQALNLMPGKELIITFDSPKAAARIDPVEKDGTEFVEVIMPLNF